MLQNICTFNNKLIIPQMDEHCVRLISYKSSGETESCISTSSFDVVSSFELPSVVKRRMKFVFLDAVYDFSTSLKCLVILCISSCGYFSFYLICDELRDITEVNDIAWPSSKFLIPNVNLFVTHGPISLYLIDSNVHMHSLNNNHKLCYNLDNIVKHGSSDILQATAVGTLLSGNYSCVVVLLVLCNKTQNAQTIKIISLAANFETATVKHRSLPLSLFFMKGIENFIKHIHISDFDFEYQPIENFDNVEWGKNLSVVAIQSQIMVFRSGTLKHVCLIPFSDIKYQRNFSDFMSNKITLILASKSQVILLKEKDDDEMQVVKSWKPVNTVLYGNILLNGSKQLLLLQTTDIISWQEGAVLVDVSSFVPIDLLNRNMIPSILMDKTVSGVERNLKAGTLTIADKELQIAQKTAATLDILRKLSCENPQGADSAANAITCTFQESLIDIILLENIDKAIESDVVGDDKTLHLQNHWTKFFDGRWVLCWSFCNKSKRKIAWLSMKLFAKNQPLQCLQKVFIHKSPTLTLGDSIANEIMPGMNFSVIVTLTTFLFSHEEIQLDGIFTWYLGSCSQINNELFLPVEKIPLSQCQMKLNTKLSQLDVLESECKDIFASEQWFCMAVLHQRTVLSLLALHSDLSKLPDLLSKCSHDLLWIHNAQFCVFKNQSSPLYGSSLNVVTSKEKMVELEVYTRNRSETLLLVQYLYHYLPGDILVHPSSLSTQEIKEKKLHILTSMKEELDLLSSALKIHEKSEDIRTKHPAISNIDTSIVVPKETYSRIRKALVKKECISDDIMCSLHNIPFHGNSGF